MKTLKIGLCRGRHEINDVAEYIFDSIADPTNVVAIEAEAFERVAAILTPYEEKAVLVCAETYDDIYANRKDVELQIYVTGLTVALIAAINAARRMARSVVLMHYNKETAEYFPQQIV